MNCQQKQTKKFKIECRSKKILWSGKHYLNQVFENQIHTFKNKLTYVNKKQNVSRFIINIKAFGKIGQILIGCEL